MAAPPSPLAQGARIADAAVTTEGAPGFAPKPIAMALRFKLDPATPLVAVELVD